MKFGSVPNADNIDFTLPNDHPKTRSILGDKKRTKLPNIYVGCAKWNKQDLKGFYPRGTKDELAYYATQFNSIELNATFYRQFPYEQFVKWGEKTPENFRFFPKVPQEISHFKRLAGAELPTELYTKAVGGLGDKLGCAFLQLHHYFGPKLFGQLEKYLHAFPRHVPLAVEVRSADWFDDEESADKLYGLLETNSMANIITDTAGRRDLLHMRLTSTTAFIRYVGANHPMDYTRLDDWVTRLETWIEQGIENIYFFVHQNLEKESPLLSAYFIEKLNEKLGFDLQVPSPGDQQRVLNL